MSGKRPKLAGWASAAAGWFPTSCSGADLSLPGAASPRAARAGIPGAGLVLAQTFERVMT